VTIFGSVFQHVAQEYYQLTGGADRGRDDTLGLLLSRPAAEALGTGVTVGDTVVLVGRLDPQIAAGAVDRVLVARGIVRWLYDYRGQPSVGTVLAVMQRLARPQVPDAASLVLVRARTDSAVPGLVERLRREHPAIEVNSVADLVVQGKRRLVYFTQLSYVLGAMSLVVAVLLIGTLLTITVNERLGEIATLRAIGVSRATVVRQVLAEGVALTLLGSALGVVLGLATARYLDAILNSFPGLPEAFSFFVPRVDTLSRAAVVLLVTGSLAGLYPAWLASRAPIAATLRAEAT
jgi:putative ABC transport system permease protein